MDLLHKDKKQNQLLSRRQAAADRGYLLKEAQ